MRFVFVVFVVLFWLPQESCSQEIVAQVIDSQTREPLPYATVQYGIHNGVITNEEGKFSIYSKQPVDSLIISSLGYETLRIGAKGFKGETLRLQPSNIFLKDVFLTNKNLTGKEILQKVKEQVSTNYNFDLSQKRIFFRESNVNNIGRFDLLVKKSTFPELDQKFMTRLSQNVPKYSDSYKEVLGDFYGNYDRQKLRVIKAANLHNPQSTLGLTELTDKFERVLKETTKERSYYKIRTGLLGVKVDSDDLSIGSSEKVSEENKPEKTPEELEKERLQRYTSLENSTLKKIKNLMAGVFWKNNGSFDVFEKSNKYNFEVEGYAQIDNSIVYILSFQPKRGANFKGKMYVNTMDYGVHRLDYQNVKSLSTFRLLGISTAKDVYRGKMIFTREEDGKYNPRYIEQEKGESFGIHRPLTIIEKNKFVKGRRKQNELDLDIKINSGDLTKYELVVYESNPLEESLYEATEKSTSFEYETFKRYNPQFWKGYNIIEPNIAIKAFTLEEETAY